MIPPNANIIDLLQPLVNRIRNLASEMMHMVLLLRAVSHFGHTLYI